MKRKHIIRTLFCCVVMLVLLFVDLITKAWADAVHPMQGERFLGIVCLRFTMNPGAAFGLSADNPKGMMAITALTVVLIIAIAVLFFTVFRRNFPVQMVLGVVEAGAVGNLVDRLYFKMVRDFIDVAHIFILPPYTCNVADIYIVFGAIVLVFFILFIGPNAVFPLTKKWREESKRLDEEREKKREEKQDRKVDKMLEDAGYLGPDEPLADELVPKKTEEDSRKEDKS